MIDSREILRQKEHLQKLYAERTADFQEKAIVNTAYATRVSIYRLIYFLGIIGLTGFCFTKSIGLGALLALFGLITFAFIIRFHAKIMAKTKYLNALEQVNLNELLIFEKKLSSFDDGAALLEPGHPYALDLDLFGPYSFFQYYNRGKTALGQKAFAEYLLHPAEEPEILSRQDAIKELSQKLDWRQDYLALGIDQKKNDQDLKLLKLLLDEEDYVRTVSWIPAIFFVMPVFFLVGFYLCSNYLPLPAILLFWAVPMLILRKFVIRINETHRKTSKAGAILKDYSLLMHAIEEEPFEADKLQGLKNQLRKEEELASQVVKKLSYIVSQLDVRNNVFVVVLNIIGLWDLYWVYRLENWKGKYKNKIQPWFDAFGEFEGLVSFGGLHYNQKHWIFPTLIKQGTFDAKNLKHPLIPQEEVVGNDLAIPASAHLKLLTGSNMAGKSTFLRTVGLNIVLGLSGAPVAADKMKLPQLDVFTSMRTQDALHESTSSFYAELKRLKMILEAVEKHNTTGEGNQPFFLLDEILKGTNSVDRHTGSKALIEQLIDEKASGIIATHDLDLGKLEASANGAIENLCIEVEVENGKLVFDFKLRKGVSKSFNATQLMREMGIKNL